jgi:diguanylate cyclase (GGDEF)-like protein
VGPELDGSDERGLGLAAELRAALAAGDGLVLHYQPRADLDTGEVLGVEALARWRRPEGGLLLPDDFISVAEEHGLMPEFTIAVLDTALGQQREWRTIGLEVAMAVNVSAADVLDRRFPDQVARVLERVGATEGALAIEITENARLIDSEPALDVLARLEELGIGICLDDFGTGHSSLARLKRLPVKQLKIDKSFVLDMLDDRGDDAIVRFTVDLGRELGLHVVAEGVETLRQWDRLADLGAHSAQGFYLARPATADALTGWLRERGRRTPPPRRRRAGARTGSVLEALMEATAAVLAADSLEDTFGRIASHLRILVPHDDLVVYEVIESGRKLRPVFARGKWADEVMADEPFPIEEGITGAVVRDRRTSNVPRTDQHPLAQRVAGTELEPEALVAVPLLVEDRAVGALNVYRLGEDVAFSPAEAEVIERFAAMAALAFNSARQRETLRTQARTDGLTGLLNHRACHERLADEVRRAIEARRRLSVVVLDLDRFKAINDTYGHAEGDRTLRAVAEGLRASVRADDAVARLGGEEFALILPGAGPVQAMEAAERAREAVASVEVAGEPMTASAGVATCPDDSRTPGHLLELADAALYRAKHAGRDRACMPA